MEVVRGEELNLDRINQFRGQLHEDVVEVVAVDNPGVTARERFAHSAIRTSAEIAYNKNAKTFIGLRRPGVNF